MGDQKVLGLT